MALHSDLPLLFTPAQLALSALMLNQARRHYQRQLDAAGDVEDVGNVGDALPVVDLTQTYV